MKAKKCKVCLTLFEPRNSLASCCSIPCAITHANNLKAKRLIEKAKKERKEYKDAKLKSKTLASWKKDAEKACNAYIRARDGKICISCGTQNPNIQYAAGHYRSVKAASQLRYNESNIHVQCNFYCNSVMGANIAAYRPALIQKIGLDRVLELENNHDTHTYTIDELKAIIAEYKLKLKQISNA